MKYFVVWCNVPIRGILVSLWQGSLVGGREMIGRPSAVESENPLFLDKIVHWKCVVGDLKRKVLFLAKNMAFPAFFTCFGSNFFFFFSCFPSPRLGFGNYGWEFPGSSVPWSPAHPLPPTSRFPPSGPISLVSLFSHKIVPASIDQSSMNTHWLIGYFRCSSSLSGFFLNFGGGCLFIYFFYLTMNHNIYTKGTWFDLRD